MGLQGRDSSDVELASDVISGIGENPFWDVEQGKVVWVDIATQEVRRLEPQSRRYEAWHMGQHVGAVVPRASGGMVVALGDGFGGLDPVDGSVRLFAPLDLDSAVLQLNDCQCDSRGRLWAGTYGASAQAACLYRLDPDHSLTVMLEGVTASNGIGWSPDDRLMYYIDSREQRVDVFDFDLSRGEITNRRPLVNVPRGDGVPDGLCVDAEGLIWVAIFGGAALHRYTPAGDLDGRVAVPALNVTSCAFGGPDLSSLYITSATASMSPTQLESYPRAGGLFVSRPGVRGQPPKAYAG
jgi:sugar lactone lactonase YvrE